MSGTYSHPAEPNSPSGQWLDAVTLNPDQLIYHARARGQAKTSAGGIIQLVRWANTGRRPNNVRVQTLDGKASYTIKKRELWWVWAETTQERTT